MARKKSTSKSVNITMEDVGYAIIGGVAGLGINGVANKALASAPEALRNNAGKIIPGIKVLGGGYVAMDKNMDRRARFFALGVAGTGAVELGIQYIPAQYTGISAEVSGAGDIFDMLGTVDTVTLDVDPATPITADRGEYFDEELVGVGGYDDYLVL